MPELKGAGRTKTSDLAMSSNDGSVVGFCSRWGLAAPSPNRMRCVALARNTWSVERLRCAGCGTVLSGPVRRVEMPAPLHWSLLDHHHINPALLEPGTYAVDQAEHGRDRVTGTYMLSPGDVRGTRFAHAWASTGCWSFDGWRPCMACEGCGTLVASRTDDCGVPQNTRFDPDLVVWEDCGADRCDAPDPFALVADWDQATLDTRPGGWVPVPVRLRPELVATRWRVRGLKSDLYRDDPPA